MIRVKVTNNRDNECLSCTVDGGLYCQTAISPDIHRYITEKLNEHLDRDVRFFVDYHRNYVEEDIFKGLDY